MISVSFFAGQLPAVLFICCIIPFLWLINFLHLNIKWSTVCSSSSHGHIGLFVSPNLGLNSRFHSRLTRPAEFRHADVHQKSELLMSLNRWKMVMRVLRISCDNSMPLCVDTADLMLERQMFIAITDRIFMQLPETQNKVVEGWNLLEFYALKTGNFVTRWDTVSF